jgi:hypothetical protein
MTVKIILSLSNDGIQHPWLISVPLICFFLQSLSDCSPYIQQFVYHYSLEYILKNPKIAILTAWYIWLEWILLFCWVFQWMAMINKKLWGQRICSVFISQMINCLGQTPKELHRTFVQYYSVYSIIQHWANH